jgi:Conjugative transposon protein TcpC
VRWAAHERGSSAAAGATVTSGHLLRGVGRVVLWCVLALLLVRGAADVLSTSRDVVPAAPVSRPAVAAWPDDRARAFAVGFARAYLSYSPRHPGRYARGLLPFVSPEVASQAVPRFAHRDSRQVVQDAVVAGAVSAGPGRALVTVAASVVGRGVSTRFLTVPVARDGHGGLVVYDLPSFAPPPARGRVAPADAEPLSGADAPAVQDVVTRFFRAFLAGRSADLEYLVAAGTRIAALGQPYELASVDSVERVGGGGSRPTVLVSVRARDVRSRAVYALRYRVELVRRDCWYVAAVNATDKAGG